MKTRKCSTYESPEVIVQDCELDRFLASSDPENGGTELTKITDWSHLY